MNPLDFPLLADENINSDIVRYLRDSGKDVRDVLEIGLNGKSDLEILRHAHAEGRAVLTHDSDFGTLAFAQREPFTGIVYLRPGHILREFTVHTLEAIAKQTFSVIPPFVIVAVRSGDKIRIRKRQL